MLTPSHFLPAPRQESLVHLYILELTFGCFILFGLSVLVNFKSLISRMDKTNQNYLFLFVHGSLSIVNIYLHGHYFKDTLNKKFYALFSGIISLTACCVKERNRDNQRDPIYQSYMKLPVGAYPFANTTNATRVRFYQRHD